MPNMDCWQERAQRKNMLRGVVSFHWASLQWWDMGADRWVLLSVCHLADKPEGPSIYRWEGPGSTEPQSPTAVTWRYPVTLAFLLVFSCLCRSPVSAPWDHLQNKLTTHMSLYQVLMVRGPQDKTVGAVTVP